MADAPPNGGNPPNPDAGKDFGYLVPSLSVGWDTPPSFDDSPPNHSGGGDAPTGLAESGPIHFDASAVRAAEQMLLEQSRNAVHDYELLREKVDAAAHSDFWGPHAPPQNVPTPGAQVPSGTGWSPSKTETDNKDDQILHDIGAEFAANINPLMQKALWQMSGALELLSNYIQTINGAGQTYARIDRSAKFPEPPGVTFGS